MILKRISVLIIFILLLSAETMAQPVYDNNLVDSDFLIEDILFDPMMLAQVDSEDTPMMMDKGPFGHSPQKFMEAMQQQRKHLEQFRLLKLLELLDLDEEHEVEFLSAFRNMRKAFNTIQEERKSLVEQLVASVKEEKVSQEQIDKLIVDLTRLENEKINILNNFLKNAHNYLTPEQLGKLIVFQEKFELELLENMRGFQNRERGQQP